MTTGIRHILAAGALVTLSACASGYVSGYDEIRQRSPAQESARAPDAKPQKQRASSKQTDTRKTDTTKKGKQAQNTGSAGKSATASLNQAQLSKIRRPAPQPAARPSSPPAQKPAAPRPQASAPPVATAQAQTVEGGAITVGPGETLFAISRRTGVELRDIVVANNLEPPYALRAGQRLSIPAARYHIVRAGETGYSISRAYGTDLTTLARLNALDKPYAVQVGQRLRLPAAPTLAANGSGAPAKAPGTAPAAPRQPAATASAAATATASTPTASTATAAAAKPVPEPAAFSKAFSWPLNGRILSRFGPKQGGLHNDGINIAAARGATVRAAAPGTVAYAGDGLKGFGWLILIKHGDGWVTAYAHNEVVLVQRGDTVRAGEPIARAGATGAVDRPQLHFEIRNGRRAVDPLRHLPPSPVS